MLIWVKDMCSKNGKVNRNSKKGVTLVELIVAMVLTAIFAVTCVALINPIERVYKSTLKLARAQLLADTIVDSIRKECDDVKHDEKMSVWIGNLSNTTDDSDLLDRGSALNIGDKTSDGGNILVFQRNNNYTEAIYSCAGISGENKTKVHNNPLTPTIITAYSVDSLSGANLEKGYVHFGYYQAKEDDNGVYPIQPYDYTNPVLASTYGDFKVNLNFNQLERKDNKYPAYVMCKVEVLEKDKTGDYKTLYTRTAMISFSANGSGTGSGSVKPQPKRKDIEVKVVWDDNNNYSGRPNDGITITLKNGDGTKPLGVHSLTGAEIRTSDPQKFTFSDIDVTDGLSISQSPNPAANGYSRRCA